MRQARIRPGTPSTESGTEHFRIEEMIVDAPVDHIHAHQPVDGLHVDAVVVADHQVRPFHQIGTHLLRQIAVLEIGGVVDARRQHDDHRLVTRARRQRRQRV